MTNINNQIAVVIPTYKVRKHILKVIGKIGPEVSWIFVVDDCCPEKSGNYVENNCQDKRVIVLRTSENLGVGGAVITGYKKAIEVGVEVIVKIDGDNQMEPSLIPQFVAPILAGQADYTKGNRFFNLEGTRNMPKVRLIGNAALSFLTKLSSGYWDIFDPTNGFTAIHSGVVQHLPLKKISRRYFFETDMLFRLNIIRAVVVDIPMVAKYGDEVSNLKARNIIIEFFFKHGRNFAKRIFYNYYLRDVSVASLELPVGIFMLLFGSILGITHWIKSFNTGITTPAGTVMLSALPVILGFQLILAFIGYDISRVPNRPFYPNANKLIPRAKLP
ncbi:MAG: glycosyltransferase family 2 protein, partial [Desulfobacteraceae bacterium]|nr:glycosyltransferase family 2 protein [Desulfobacteraceae bacterium]